MRARSVATRQLDPYRAGLELGESLRELQPEVVFLFSSIHYGGNPELTEGLHDALAAEPVVLGATGDGIYETGTVLDVGAVALGLHSDGRVRWHLASATGVGADATGAFARGYEQLAAATGAAPLALCILFADFRADAACLVDGLTRRIQAPAVGGLAGDDYRLERSYVYAGREVLDDGLVLLGVTGDLRCAIHVAGDLTPLGRPGLVTDAEGTELRRIDGRTAMDFITAQAGKPLFPADLGICAFRLTGQDDPSLCCLRTIRRIAAEGGGVTLFGAVQEGQRIQFCQASPEVIVKDVRSISNRLGREPGRPAAGLVISCAGRKRVLGSRRDDREIDAVRQGYGSGFPLAGFPSFGEIGPRRNTGGYTRTLFHNMTSILLVFEV